MNYAEPVCTLIHILTPPHSHAHPLPDRTVKVWDLRSGSELLSLDKHFSYVRKVKYCARSKLIFTASQSLIKVGVARTAVCSVDSASYPGLPRTAQENKLQIFFFCACGEGLWVRGSCRPSLRECALPSVSTYVNHPRWKKNMRE